MKRLIVAAALAVAAVPAPASSASTPAPTAAAGKKYFFRCVACHTMDASARPMTGPHLENIVGRPVAALDFAYTDALRAQDFVWTEEKLDHFLEKPQADVPGLCLPFTGLRRPDQRASLIAYLKDPG